MATSGAVEVIVQVVGLDPKTLQMSVPTYLRVEDLTQRVAVDSGLQPYWKDGSRRGFVLRARGRVLGGEERLADLDVQANELLHLLPEPPPGVQVRERPRGRERDGTASRVAAAVAHALAVLAFTLGWFFALMQQPGPWLGLFPGMGLGLLCATFAHHAWGRSGRSLWVPLTGLGLYLPLMLMAMSAVVVAEGEWWPDKAFTPLVGVFAGVMGIVVAWLAWFGPLDTPPRDAYEEEEVSEEDEEAAAAAAATRCGICGHAVAEDVMRTCPRSCGRVFHQGCYSARIALVAQEPGAPCSICGEPARAT